MDLFQAIVLALIQGISAWIPVSSKTQVIIAGNWFFGISFKTALAYALLLHLGDLIAALLKYRKEYSAAIALLKKPREVTDFSKKEVPKFLIISLIATCLVALPAYFLVKKVFYSLSGEPLLFIIGILLIGMATISYFSKSKKTIETPVSLKKAIITGAFQGLAVIPGISRSGITQATLLLQKTNPEKAMHLSFIMSAPMIAFAFAGFYFIEGFAEFSLSQVIIGITVSAIASFITMSALTKIAKKIPNYFFLAAIGVIALVPMMVKILFKI